MLSTVVDYVSRREPGLKRPSWAHLSSSGVTPAASLRSLPTSQNPPPEIELTPRDAPPPAEDPEYRLPDRTSLFLMIATNAFLQFSFFVTVSSASAYAESLGGSALFSGLTIGIPTVFSGLMLIPLKKLDQGRYTRPLRMVWFSLILGNILHAVAYQAKFLYLILIGRMVTGLGFTGFMYTKRYCSDPRIVGIRRRTTLATWLVLGQAFGFSAGPFIGGLLYKVGFSNKVFNGYTSPGWVTSSFWVFFAIASTYLFRDLPKPHRLFTSNSVEAPPPTTSEPEPQFSITQLTAQQWGIIASMCWSSMTCFFILGAWESNIPVFTASHPSFHYSPYSAGNFIALGGIATVPFLLGSIRYSPRFQDRTTLAVGSAIGSLGLFLTLICLLTDKIVFASLYISWFLVALGFNLASTCTLSLLSKQFSGPEWNVRTSLAIQYSNYAGRVTGAILGGAGVSMGMRNYVAVQIGVVGVGALLHMTFWKELKAKTG
ncbi:major facilitator superfamily domain-containing protein [Roridomyces roridus]|uniref:Major facilitator superfamily domain-containing protein n=1 Tax=Roridomyces roridus TaxID=1738132 RepID=A0AAD7CL92_9AGAR|nr:major facilitator superfamily domain-containing protein [Roridomyces roridus]